MRAAEPPAPCGVWEVLQPPSIHEQMLLLRFHGRFCFAVLQCGAGLAPEIERSGGFVTSLERMCLCVR